MPLHVTRLGDAGSLVVFCHGLFGQGKNWTSAAKALSDEHRSVLVDMPQHGRSPWSPEFDYVAMADTVAEVVADLGEPAALVGHSMGGKIAMLLALRHPDLVERLCVVDMSPVAYPPAHDFVDFVTAMRSVDLATLERRADADQQLTALVPDPTIRGFLLQNLRRTDDDGPAWRWSMNLDVLGDHLPDLGDWPEGAIAGASYDGPVLWIGGANSPYVQDSYVAAMLALFPNTWRVTIKNAGHWVHSEQPAVFVEVVRRFLDG